MDIERLESAVTRLEKIADKLGGQGIDLSSFTIVPAYERAELGPHEVIADGSTVNADGSIWDTVKDVRIGKLGTPFRVNLGYISPKKFPIIFEAAKRIWGDERLVEAWKANPFGLYKADVRPMIFSGTADAINLGYLLQPYTTHQQ